MIRSDATFAACRVRLGALPARVGGWELVRLAGSGGWAEIYQARPMRSAGSDTANYAVKMLRTQWQDRPEAVAILRREAQVGRQVSHPHLVPVLASNTTEPPCFLVMPWLAGRTIANWLATGVFDLPRVLWFARQTAEALDGLWAAGWMHGDLNLANLHVSPSGHVTLLDLGFARHRDADDSPQDRSLQGTIGYLAPEMLTSTFRPDIRSDIYSLGAILFQLLAGRLPFQAQTLSQLATEHRETRAPNLRQLGPHLPTGVVRLVREMLANEPLRRPQTPRELIGRLTSLEIATFAEREASLDWTAASSSGMRGEQRSRGGEDPSC